MQYNKFRKNPFEQLIRKNKIHKICIWKQNLRHVKIFDNIKTKLAFNSLSFSFNDFVDSLAHGKDSSVYHINRHQFQRGLDSCGKGSKTFSGYLLIQSTLTQPLLDNMKDVFDRVQLWTSYSSGNFLSVSLIPGRSGFYTVLCKITILQETSPT